MTIFVLSKIMFSELLISTFALVGKANVSVSFQEGIKRDRIKVVDALWNQEWLDLWVNLAGFQQRDCLLSDIDND